MENLKDKNLLIIANSYPNKDNSHYGGIFVKEQVRYLKDYFNEVYVISPQPWGVHRDLQNYMHGGVRVFFPRFFHLPVEHFRKRLGDNFFRAVLKVINREGLEFDLIHAHFTWPSGYAGVRLKEKFNVPVIITTHALHRAYLDILKRRNAISTWNRADALINVSRKCLLLLKDFGIEKNKLWYVPNGVNLSKFYPADTIRARRLLGIPSNKKILVSVGYLVEKKGFEYGIRAMKNVLKTRDDVLLYIVGGGYLRKKLENMIGSLGLDDYVYLVGPKPHQEIPLWMNAADIFVLPSLVENFGVVNIEAMACGRPVVSTYNGGSEEIITSEDYGLLCPPKDPECLAEKILIALEKEWDREKIRKYAEHFNWSNVARRIVGIYESLLY